MRELKRTGIMEKPVTSQDQELIFATQIVMNFGHEVLGIATMLNMNLSIEIIPLRKCHF